MVSLAADLPDNLAQNVVNPIPGCVEKDESVSFSDVFFRFDA